MANRQRQLLDEETLALLDGRDLNIRGLLEGWFGGNRRSAHHGSSMEFDDYRAYLPGDDPRRIDWNLYGRTDELYLRLFTDERRQHHRFYIDLSASMAWGEPEKRRTALELVAALSYLAVGASDRVSWYALEGTECRRVCEAVSGREDLFLSLETLASLECRGDTRMDESVPRCPDPGFHDGVSFLISDFLTDAPWKGAVDWLLGKKREVCLLRVLSRDEIAPELTGKVQLTDAEAVGEDDPRNRRMEIGRARLAAYAKAYAWLEEDIRSFAVSRGVRAVTVPSDKPVGRILFDEAIKGEIMR